MGYGGFSANEFSQDLLADCAYEIREAPPLRRYESMALLIR